MGQGPSGRGAEQRVWFTDSQERCEGAPEGYGRSETGTERECSTFPTRDETCSPGRLRRVMDRSADGAWKTFSTWKAGSAIGSGVGNERGVVGWDGQPRLNSVDEADTMPLVGE